jgi:signal transduction histidine kinase
VGRLFWKIFLSFWFSLILVLLFSNWGTALYLRSFDANERASNRERVANTLLDTISSILEYSGIPAVRKTLRHSKRRMQQRFTIKISNQRGRVILHKKARFLAKFPNKVSTPIALQRTVNNPQGRAFHIQVIFYNRSRPSRFFNLFARPFEHFPPLIFIWLGSAIFISGLVCFWLAWYITKPIQQLQRANRQLAAGNLDTRVAHIMGKRRDEITDLGQDFDHMAARLQHLLLSQKQLLSDISHELRSPLARLHVAVGLMRQKTGSIVQKELDRIEREIVRLDNLVGQILTLSRLETGNRYRKDDYIDIVLLLEEIVQDAQFEADSKQIHIALHSQGSGILKANTELLQRAIENILRNAIRYSADNSQIEVSLTIQAQSQVLQLKICDQGQGVPEAQLQKLFEPFVRLSDSRQRQKGQSGYGLGLAIAERAVHLHHGSISAFNHPQGGLCVVVELSVEAAIEALEIE